MTSLIIAYGNTLRGDDAAGPALAETIKSWHMPEVAVLVVQQLVPELIEDMKHVRRVLFVDAALTTGGFTVDLLSPCKTRRTLGHYETPANLLALLSELEGRVPEAWLLAIPASSLEHGAAMTAATTQNIQAALDWVRTWLQKCSEPNA